MQKKIFWSKLIVSASFLYQNYIVTGLCYQNKVKISPLKGKQLFEDCMEFLWLRTFSNNWQNKLKPNLCFWSIPFPDSRCTCRCVTHLIMELCKKIEQDGLNLPHQLVATMGIASYYQNFFCTRHWFNLWEAVYACVYLHFAPIKFVFGAMIPATYLL